tara:strand:+ start:990 stop:1148 length:159 start_codon:yes stop_codon:yes gene_type:complete
MTNEQFTEEVLIKSHSLGIKERVFEFAKQLRENDRTLDFYGSIQSAFDQITK